MCIRDRFIHFPHFIHPFPPLYSSISPQFVFIHFLTLYSSISPDTIPASISAHIIRSIPHPIHPFPHTLVIHFPTLFIHFPTHYSSTSRKLQDRILFTLIQARKVETKHTEQYETECEFSAKNKRLLLLLFCFVVVVALDEEGRVW